MLSKLFLLVFIIFTSSFSQNVSEKFAMAMEEYYQERFASAYRIFQDVSDDYGIDDELYASAKYYAADALIKMGEKEPAAAELEYIVNQIIWSNFREEAFYHLGLIYFDKQRYSTSRTRFKSLLSEFPGGKYTGSAMYWIGESYAEEDNLDDAEDFLKKAIEDRARNKFRDYSIYTLAAVYERKDEYENAVKYYDELLSYHRNSPLLVSAQIRIGYCYFYLKDYQSSILELNNPILDNLPDNLYSESLFLLANAHYRVQEYSDAERVYSELLKTFPDSDVKRDAEYGLAWSLFQQRKYDDAFITFDNLSTGNDSIAIESFYWKAEANRYAGNNEAAIKIYRDLLIEHPNSFIIPKVEYELGLLYFNIQDLTLSKRYLLTAASSEQINVKARAFTLLGEIELNSKQYASAKNYFEPVLSYANDGSDIQLRSMLGLGAALYYLGRNDEAIQHLNLILASSPDFERDRVIYYLAENYFSKQNYNEALKRYNVIDTQDDLIKKMSLYGSAYCYFNLGDYDNAAFRFSEFTKMYPGDERITDAKLRLADSYFGSKNYRAASEVYKQLFTSRNFTLDDPYAYYQYAQALYKSGRTTSAINEFTALQSKYPYSKYGDVSLFTIGWIRFQQNNYRAAINDYRNVLTVYKNTSLTPVIYYSIGDAFFNMEQYDSAIVNYRKVLSDFPSSSYVFDAVNGIQYCYVVKNQPERAIAQIDRFVEENPSLQYSDQVYFKKGEIYYSQRDYENAKESYKDFILKFNNSSLVPEAYYWIGKCSDNLEEYEEATLYFNTVFKEYPTSEISGSAVLEMGAIHNSLENYETAIATYNEAISAIKGSSAIPEILYMKGMTYISADSLQQAYEVFTDVSYYYRETIFADKAKFEMGVIDLAVGRYENSDKHFLEISENRNDELGAKAQYYYGQSLYEQGNITEAISALVRVRTVFSNYDEWLTKSYILLGDCYVELNDKRKAEEMYRSVISKHRNDIFGKEAREKLRNLN
ncbi:MAG: tetratricopeptide repeat protein [Ignavibacterium sp.]|nr:MAG: tetratricopeptide repeat protein [Ignavibacterium sp.]